MFFDDFPCGSVLEGADYWRAARELHHVKANLACSPDPSSGGEGVWVLVGDDAKSDYDADGRGLFPAVLDNDSVDWGGLVHGTVVPVLMRGEMRPCVPHGWLSAHFQSAR